MAARLPAESGLSLRKTDGFNDLARFSMREQLDATSTTLTATQETRLAEIERAPPPTAQEQAATAALSASFAPPAPPPSAASSRGSKGASELWLRLQQAQRERREEVALIKSHSHA